MQLEYKTRTFKQLSEPYTGASSLDVNFGLITWPRDGLQYAASAMHGIRSRSTDPMTETNHYFSR